MVDSEFTVGLTAAGIESNEREVVNMFRKLALATAGCLTLLSLGAMAPSASAHDPGCNDNNWPLGVYNDAGQSRRFDLNFSPSTANTAALVTGGANLCGTNDENGVFYTNGTITYPNLGEKVQCARPNPPVSQCDQNGNGRVDRDENIPEGSYTGSSVSDVWCDNYELFGCLLYHQQPNVSTKNYVRFAGSGNSHCGTGADTVACFQAESTILNIACDSDIVVTKRGANRPYTMNIYQPTCAGIGPVYFDNIDDLVICDYAGAVDPAASCGDSTHPWMQKNGNAVPYRFSVSASLIGGPVPQLAQAAGSWT